MSVIKSVSPFITSNGKEVDVRKVTKQLSINQPFNFIDIGEILDIPTSDILNATEALTCFAWIETNTQESRIQTNKAWVFKGAYKPEELVQLGHIQNIFGGNRPIMPRTEAEQFLKANNDYHIIWEFREQDNQTT